MAHFGVQKAKKMLALASVAAVASAGLLSANNASAIRIGDLARGTDYDCSHGDSYVVNLKSANAIKLAVENQEDFYKADSANCYVDWGSTSPVSSEVKFYINSGEYTFDEVVKRGENSAKSDIIIGTGADVVFKGTNNNVGIVDEQGTFRVPFRVEGGSTLRFDSGKYGIYIDNEGGVTFNGGTFADLNLVSTSGSVVVNGGNFVTEATLPDSNTPEGTFHLINAANSIMNINGGEFDLEYHKYPININPSLIENSGTLNVSGGEFIFDFTNNFGVGTTDKPYYGDPGALIRNSGKTEITGGTFNGLGTLVNQYGSSSEVSTKIKGGTFEVESMYTSLKLNGEESPTTLEVTGGTFNTRKTFYLADYKDKLPTSQAPGSDSNPYGLWTDGTDVRSGMATGPTSNSPYSLGKVTQNGIKGGDFSDGTHVGPATGYSAIDLDTDFDGDGEKDIRVLENADQIPYGVSVGVGEQRGLNLGDPKKGAWRIYSIENDDRCSAAISNGQIVFTGLKPTSTTPSYCSVTVVSDAKIWKYSVNVNAVDTYTDGEPLSISTGETKTPEDFEGNPDDYEWSVIEGEEYCTVNEKGEITAVKGGGSCTVEAYDPETKEHITWEVKTTNPIEMEIGDTKKPEDLPEGAEDGEWSSDNTEVCTVAEDGTITAKKAGTCHVTLRLDDGSVYTWAVNIKANPDTADNMKAITFSIAGAAIAGFGAMVAVAKRFIRR